jgi:sarcosine oxidase subunit gamma
MSEHAMPHTPTAPLTPVSPLAGIGLSTFDGIARLLAGGPVGRLALRADLEIALRIGAALGLPLDGRINRAVSGDGLAALRLGPDEWLLLADAERDPWLSARIGEAAEGMAFSLIDVSHRTATLVLEGDQAEAVLSAGCPLPLDEGAFPVDRATRTLHAKSEIVLWRRAPRRFHIEVAASFAPYVVASLAQSMADEAAIRAHSEGR